MNETQTNASETPVYPPDPVHEAIARLIDSAGQCGTEALTHQLADLFRSLQPPEDYSIPQASDVPQEHLDELLRKPETMRNYLAGILATVPKLHQFATPPMLVFNGKGWTAHLRVLNTKEHAAPHVAIEALLLLIEADTPLARAQAAYDKAKAELEAVTEGCLK